MQLAIFSILGAVLYRIGGTKYGTKYRDWGVPTCMLWYILMKGEAHWSLVICWILMFAAQTTYFKKKGTDAKWYNWLFVGIAFSMSMLPYTLLFGSIHGFIYRSIIVTLFTLFWSEAIGKAWIEESGRGFIQIITLPLL